MDGDRIVHTTIVHTNPEDHENNGGEDAKENDYEQTNNSQNQYEGVRHDGHDLVAQLTRAS